MTQYERAVEYEAIVLYDADCPYCSAATEALRQVDELGAVSWSENEAQEFLRAQFGETPFAVVLVDADEECVYAGSSAAGELAQRADAPELVSDLVEQEFDRVESLIDRLNGHDKGTVSEDFHGVYELTEEANEQFDSLAYFAWTLPER